MSSELTFDIQVDIIKRLPVKSLIQFRSVCKAWKSLIDSSQFIAGYNVRRNQPKHLMIRYRVGYGEDREVKYVCFVDDDSFPQQKLALTVTPLDQQNTIVVDICHGLFCLINLGRTSENDTVVLWNPAIRKSIAIVVPNQVDFDYIFGFGVCPDTKDPKIVKITYIYDERNMERLNCQVMVFTLSSGEWTTSCSTPPSKSIKLPDYQVVIGQLIYWVADELNAMADGFNNLIMSFDFSNEKFKEVKLPDSLLTSHLTISRLRESLVLFEYNIDTIKQVCCVWMMDHGDQQTFTKQFTIKAPDASVSWALGFRKTGDPIIQLQYVDEDDVDEDSEYALAVYEPCLDHIKGLGIRGDIHSFFVSLYSESLLLLDYEDGHIVKGGAVKR